MEGHTGCLADTPTHSATFRSGTGAHSRYYYGDTTSGKRRELAPAPPADPKTVSPVDGTVRSPGDSGVRGTTPKGLNGSGWTADHPTTRLLTLNPRVRPWRDGGTGTGTRQTTPLKG